MSGESWFFPLWLLGTDTIPSIVWKLSTLSSLFRWYFPQPHCNDQYWIEYKRGTVCKFPEFFLESISANATFLGISVLSSQLRYLPASVWVHLLLLWPRTLPKWSAGQSQVPPGLFPVSQWLLFFVACYQCLKHLFYFHIYCVCFVCLFIFIVCFSEKGKSAFTNSILVGSRSPTVNILIVLPPLFYLILMTILWEKNWHYTQFLSEKLMTIF